MDWTALLGALPRQDRGSLRAALADVEDAASRELVDALEKQVEQKRRKALEREGWLVTWRDAVVTIDGVLETLARVGSVEAAALSEVFAGRRAELLDLIERDPGSEAARRADELELVLDALQRRALVAQDVRAALARMAQTQS